MSRRIRRCFERTAGGVPAFHIGHIDKQRFFTFAQLIGDNKRKACIGLHAVGTAVPGCERFRTEIKKTVRRCRTCHTPPVCFQAEPLIPKTGKPLLPQRRIEGKQIAALIQVRRYWGDCRHGQACRIGKHEQGIVCRRQFRSAAKSLRIHRHDRIAFQRQQFFQAAHGALIGGKGRIFKKKRCASAFSGGCCSGVYREQAKQRNSEKDADFHGSSPGPFCSPSDSAKRFFSCAKGLWVSESSFVSAKSPASAIPRCSSVPCSSS